MPDSEQARQGAFDRAYKDTPQQARITVLRARRQATMPDLAARHELCEANVTLDGQPARISGARNEFATVRLAGSGLAAEFAWSTVALVVSRGGAFQS